MSKEFQIIELSIDDAALKNASNPLHTLKQVRINVMDALDPDMVGLPMFIDIGSS